MFEGWSQRTRELGDGRTERFVERAKPGCPGVVEQWFYEVELSEYGALSEDPWTETRSSVQPSRVRARSAAPPLSTHRRFSVVFTEAARADMSREIRRDWDGREVGGALVGRIDGGRVVVERAGGLGVGVVTERSAGAMRPAFARHFEFALSCGGVLVGGWHTHPPGYPLEPSDADVKAWQMVREVLGTPVYVGQIFTPRRVRTLGLTPWQDEECWSFETPEPSAPNARTYIATADGHHTVTPTL